VGFQRKRKIKKRNAQQKKALTMMMHAGSMMVIRRASAVKERTSVRSKDALISRRAVSASTIALARLDYAVSAMEEGQGAQS